MKGIGSMDTNVWNVFHEFMKYGDWYPRPIPNYSNYFIDRFGNVYDNNMNYILPYYNHKDGYLTIYLTDDFGKHHVWLLHRLVAYVYDSNWNQNCVVHHLDENKHNNNDWNLECMERSDHSRMHSEIKYRDMLATCQVCGGIFVWTATMQMHYYIDIRRGHNRYITCSKPCSSYIGRMIQLNRPFVPIKSDKYLGL
jgi:hypothetical protein